MIKFIDGVYDQSWGDVGKGQITFELAKRPEYTHTIRCGGGQNAGHTIHTPNGKFVTHSIPCGVFHNKPSIIGPGCVLNVNKFFKELKDLNDFGVKTEGLVFIAKNTHIVTEAHIAEEANESKVGTTKQGIGPCYRDKYNRTGIRAESIPELKPFLIDMYEYFYGSDEIGLLVEGAQGFNLDIDHGNYPFVTSSHPTVAGALLNGLPWNKVRKVYGCAKAYDTYVGSNKFEPQDDPIYAELRTIGGEFGATTGRPRQCNWLDIISLRKAVRMNGVTHLVISKLDVLRELNVKHDNQHWKVLVDGHVCSFSSEQEYVTYVESAVTLNTDVKFVEWRNSPSDTVKGDGLTVSERKANDEIAAIMNLHNVHISDTQVARLRALWS